MKDSSNKIEVAVLDYSGAQKATILGLNDLFSTANRYRTIDSANNIELTVETVKAISDKAYDAILIPPCLNGHLDSSEMPSISSWILSQHHAGTIIGSICGGAFLLAETGLLDNRPATTHWDLEKRFLHAFPKVKLKIDKLLIDDGDIITAGGIMAWVDLGLKLIDRFLGASVMLASARYFLVDPGGREQRFYSLFSPSLTHGDKTIVAIQHWLQNNSHASLSVPLLASRANLTERTFTRRFNKATGLNMTEYIQYLRVGKARELIETSSLNFDQVAWNVGYHDTSAFRRVFHKIMGLTPGEYRRRFRTF